MTELSMGPIVAEIMEAMGHPEAAATLRWSQRPQIFEDLALELEAYEEQREWFEGQLAELRRRDEDRKHYLVALRKLLRRAWDDISVEQIDEARRLVKAALK